METTTLLIFFAFFQIGDADVTFCSLPEISHTLFTKCVVDGKSTPCTYFMPVGSQVLFQCDDFYRMNNYSLASINCIGDGEWDSPLPSCIPDCGKSPTVIPLIVNGRTVSARSFPWHAAIYHFDEENWEFWCGGSLISQRMILTAAHCAWLVPAEKLKVGLQKTFREIMNVGENALLIDVIRVEMLHSYQDVGGNYNGDLSVLFMKEAVKFSESVIPICIDWDQAFIEQQLQPGNTGIVLGWGLTENDTFSDELRGLRLPVLSDDVCIEQEQKDFRKYVTYTTFCAGFTNGTGVCNGDSGGGLSFLDRSSDTWYIQGLVSVSPRRRGTPYCDPKFYTVFTKVAMFTKWLRKMKLLEQILW